MKQTKYEMQTYIREGGVEEVWLHVVSPRSKIQESFNLGAVKKGSMKERLILEILEEQDNEVF